jgi:predicted metal-dependent hydrolase
MPQQTPEYIYAEKPTTDQVVSMGWQYIEGSWDNAQITERENFKQVLISDRLRPILGSQIAALVNRIGASPRSVQVRELGYRWGSCGHKGDLYFYWRVAMLPRTMIEYVVVQSWCI